MYLLDSNVCIRFLNGRSDNIRRNLLNTTPESIHLCSVVKAELYCGAAKSNFPERTLSKVNNFCDRFNSYPFDDCAALKYGQIRAYLEGRGQVIGPNDLMIAAIAVVNNLTLVTHNTKEFSRVEGLKLIDWE